MAKVQPQAMSRQWVVWGAIGAALLLSLIYFAGDGSGLARATVAFSTYEADMGRYPIRGSRYQSTETPPLATFPPAPGSTIPTEIISMDLQGVTPPPIPPVSLPPVGQDFAVDSFFDIAYEMRLGGGDFQVDSFFDITYRIDNSGGGDPGDADRPPSGVWDTEIVSLSLTGIDPIFGQVVLRESPTIPSIGQHRILPQADGSFVVDSFFDIWTEVSINGEPFQPANSSFRLDLTSVVPEPASALLALLGGAGLLTRRRRRR